MWGARGGGHRVSGGWWALRVPSGVVLGPSATGASGAPEIGERVMPNVVSWDRPTDEEVRRASNEACDVDYGAEAFRWFGLLAVSLREAVAWKIDDGPADHWVSDLVNEVVDGAVPVYNHDRWDLFMDSTAWAYSEECAAECGPLPSNMTDAAGWVLYHIGARFAYAFLRGDGWAV